MDEKQLEQLSEELNAKLAEEDTNNNLDDLNIVVKDEQVEDPTNK